MTAAPSLPSFAVRVETPEDRNFVLTWWRKGEKEASGHLEGARFNVLQDGQMHTILDRQSTVVLIAYAVGDPTSIAAFLVCRPGTVVLQKGPGPRAREVGPAPIVYYAFTRPEARRLGLQRMLLGDLVERRDVLFTSRPARIRMTTGEQWQPSPVKIPRAWTYCPRAAFVEVS